MKDVFIVVGDLGSAADLVPVAQELEARKIGVQWLADPNGKARTDVLEKKDISYEMLLSSECQGPLPKVILCGTSSGYADLQVSWTLFGKAQSIPVLWYEDLWGTGEQENERGADPDVMLVLDDIAAKIALNIRPNIATTVVGKPTFGKIPAFEEIPAIRARIREKLGLTESDFLVSWGFQGEPAKMAVAHVGEILRSGLKLDDGMIVAWRLHPKHLRRDELWEVLTKTGIRYVEEARSVDLLELYLSSNAVIVPWGATDGYKAVLRGIPTITPMFPSGEQAKKLYDFDDLESRISSGFINGMPPLLMGNNEWWGATSLRNILYLLRLIREREDVCRKGTLERSLSFKGLEEPGAASRIADVVAKYL
ncbi:hypothetical protein HYT00_03485 [Candidatus Giovannonibacteria bacterium]|nr:hypothetical protein [Candidatus Giovannonibacteria bacterium]